MWSLAWVISFAFHVGSLASSAVCSNTDDACIEIPATSQSLLQIGKQKQITEVKDCDDEAGDCGCGYGVCAAIGDPHMTTFDGYKFDVVGRRRNRRRRPEYASRMIHQLVKSPEIDTQIRTDGHFLTTGFAASGTFLAGNKLVVTVNIKSGAFSVRWNGKEIMNDKDEFSEILGASHSEVVNFKRWKGSDGMQFGKDSKPMELLKKWNKGGVRYSFELPHRVKVFVNGMRWKGHAYLDVFLKMPKGAGLEGICGNFNENPDDDQEVTKLQNNPGLDPGKSLFGPSPWASLIEGLDDAKTTSLIEDSIGEGNTAVDCTNKVPDTVLRACSGLASHPYYHKVCIEDVCTTGDVAMADMIALAEVEEEEYGKGVPEFMGHGRCLDKDHKHYTSLETGATDKHTCMEALRHMAHTHDVVGAQLQDGGKCQILTEPGHASVGEGVIVEGEGSSMVESVTDEADWSCWKMIAAAVES